MFSRVWLFATPWTIAARFICPWNSPGKNIGVGRWIQKFPWVLTLNKPSEIEVKKVPKRPGESQCSAQNKYVLSKPVNRRYSSEWWPTFTCKCRRNWTFSYYVLGCSDGKESACNAGNPGSIPGLEDPLEKEMATHSRTLAWRIPWTEEPGGLLSMDSQTVGHDWPINYHLQLCNF